jgi:hypothetical protein
MPMRGQLPITLTLADEIRRSIGTIWDEIGPLAKDEDLLTVCAVSAIGLVLSAAFTVAFRFTSESVELLARAFGG